MLLAGSANHTPLASLITAISVVLFLQAKVHPLPLMAIAAWLTIAGWL